MRKRSYLALSILLMSLLIVPPTGTGGVYIGHGTYLGISGRLALYSGNVVAYAKPQPTFLVGKTHIPTPLVSWEVWKSDNYLLVGDRSTDNIFIFAYSPGTLLPTGSITIRGFEWASVAGDDKFYIKGADGLILINSQGKIIGWPQKAQPSPPLPPQMLHLAFDNIPSRCIPIKTATLAGAGIGKRIEVQISGSRLKANLWFASADLPFYISRHIRAYMVDEMIVILSNRSISLWKPQGNTLKLIRWKHISSQEVAIGPLIGKPEGAITDFVSGKTLLPYVSAEAMVRWITMDPCSLYNALTTLCALEFGR